LRAHEEEAHGEVPSALDGSPPRARAPTQSRGRKRQNVKVCQVRESRGVGPSGLPWRRMSHLRAPLARQLMLAATPRFAQVPGCGEVLDAGKLRPYNLRYKCVARRAARRPHIRVLTSAVSAAPSNARADLQALYVAPARRVRGLRRRADALLPEVLALSSAVSLRGACACAPRSARRTARAGMSSHERLAAA